MSKERIATDIIHNSAYSEFPDIIATIQLAMYYAKKDYRNIQEAMRFTARECLKRAVNENLRRTLKEMMVSTIPETQMTNLFICQLKMRDELALELKGKTVRARGMKLLR